MPHEYQAGVHVDLPWHKLATAVVMERQFDTAEALREGQLDWRVNKEPATRNGEELPGHYWLVRSDDDVVLNHVGQYYVPINNEQGFSWMDLLLGDAHGFHYTSACSLRRGEKVVLTARAPFALDFPTSSGELYVTMLLNHGSGSLQAIATPIQTVCMNTLTAALSAAERLVKIRHTRSAEEKLANAQHVLGLTKGAAELASERAEKLFKKKLSDKQLQEFLERLVPAGDSNGSETRAWQTREQIGLLYNGEELGAPEMRGTAWGALNAAIAYNDHLAGGRDSRESSAAENVFERIMNADNIGSKAADLLMVGMR